MSGEMKTLVIIAGILLVAGCQISGDGGKTDYSILNCEKARTRIAKSEIEDKIRGGWLGQMVGVAFGASTEFCYRERMIPKDKVPEWRPEMINDSFGQDDLYVEVPFMDAMRKYGSDCDVNRLAEAFRDSKFVLWHANYKGRENLRQGITPPLSGSYLYNCHSEDIDWQIECDFLGMMYPGLPGQAAQRAFEIGHIMNYGDGVYGGVFVSALHAAAFTASSVEEICWRATILIPEGTLFRQVMDEVWECCGSGMTWEECWEKINANWGEKDRCPELSGKGNIDAKINSAFVLMGLLYGGGDMEKSMKISMRCGEDSDCNPSTVASVLGNYYGAERLEARYKAALDPQRRFDTTDYTFDGLVELNFELAQETLLKSGARQEEEDYALPMAKLSPVPFEQMPEGLFVDLTYEAEGNGYFHGGITPYGTTQAVERIVVDLGDGRIMDSIPVRFGYARPGNYTIVATATGADGRKASRSCRLTAEKAVDDLEVITCSVFCPTGGGSRNIGVIRDGIVPKSADNLKEQYDTFGGTSEEVYIGYAFEKPRDVLEVVFHEGAHFPNGGWFKDRELKLEVLRSGRWQTVEYVMNPGMAQEEEEKARSRGYGTFTFIPIEDGGREVMGVRLRGLGGGAAHFISCGELEVK